MVNIKIICSCGQKYSFDVYPFNGRMPAPVQCPVCGIDGTAAANEIMARALGPATAAAIPQPPATVPEQPATTLKLMRPAPSAPPVPSAGLAAPSGPVSHHSPDQELPDAVKDAWKWCRNLVAGWRQAPFPTATAGNPPSAENIWRQRALEAERLAEQALAAARADLAPHLAQALKEALVQELAVQRRELLQAQQIAAAEIAQLSLHLDELKAPLQERLRLYETRIKELEKELAARSEENRELLRLKIEMVRHQLEVERTRNRVAFN